jgi:hypothetical protein
MEQVFDMWEADMDSWGRSLLKGQCPYSFFFFYLFPFFYKKEERCLWLLESWFLGVGRYGKVVEGCTELSLIVGGVNEK